MYYPYSTDDYELLVDRLISLHDYEIAMYKAVGSATYEEFRTTGDVHAAVLKYHGLSDGMSIYDLGCGSAAPRKLSCGSAGREIIGGGHRRPSSQFSEKNAPRL